MDWALLIERLLSVIAARGIVVTLRAAQGFPNGL